jgi:transcriptional regulator with PAS, ATPase and Fis domain
MSGRESGGQRTITGDGRLQAQQLRVDIPLARLAVVYPPGVELAFTVGSRRAVLGRDPEDATPPVDEPTVSRRHLAIDYDARAATRVATELGSRNGSWIDGRKLAHGEQAPLAAGAVIRIGHVILIHEAVAVGARLPWTDTITTQSGAAAPSLEAIPGSSMAASRLRAAVAQAAPDPAPVLVAGETGTGKELIAAELHRLSGRRGPFVPVNCAALSPQLVESQLFGHVRGAFTGADDAQPGLVRAAQGGTLFLDEIGEMPLLLQAKLLRLIQENEIQPVGSARAVKVDVRIVAATNRELGGAIDAGGFRRDLYARLALLEIRVPPLRERRADILGWVARLHRRLLERRGGPGAGLAFEPAAAEALLLNPWPENLRGLDRLVHELSRAPHEGPVAAHELPGWLAPAAPAIDATPSAPDLPQRVPDRDELEAMLRQTGSVRATAKHFGRDRRQIYRWIEAYGIAPLREG